MSFSLVKYGQGGDLFVPEACETAIKELDKKYSGLPVKVVSVAGRYRSGKSVLLSLLTGNSQAFSIGHTMEGHTRGLDLYPVCRDGTLWLFIDSEGLFDVKNSKNHDFQLLCLLFLCSSTVLLNLQTSLDSQTFENLETLNQLQRALADDDEDCMMNLSNPALWFIIRDHHLKLQTTEDQYLEESLRFTSDSRTSANAQNDARQAILMMFSDRHLRCLPPPVEHSKLTQLNSIPWSEWNEDFRGKSVAVVQEILSSTRTFNIKSSTVSVSATVGHFLELVKHVVQNLNKKGFPGIGSLWESVSTAQNARLTATILDGFAARADAALAANMNYESEDINKFRQLWTEEAMERYVQRAMGENKGGVERLQLDLKSRFGEFEAAAVQQSRIYCDGIGKKYFGILDSRLNDKYYSEKERPYESFNADFLKAKDLFEGEKNKGVAAQQILSEIIQKYSEIGRGLLVFDTTITEVHKQAEALKLKYDEEAAETKARQQLIISEIEALRKERESIKSALLKQQCRLSSEAELRMKELREDQERFTKQQVALSSQGFASKANEMRVVAGSVQGQIETNARLIRQMNEEQAKRAFDLQSNMAQMQSAIKDIAVRREQEERQIILEVEKMTRTKDKWTSKELKESVMQLFNF